MKGSLILLLTLCQAAFTAGLSFSLTARTPSLPEQRRPCAVLNCVESYSASVSGVDQGHVTTNFSSTTITSLKVFITRPASSESGTNHRRHLLVSLTLTHPNITRVSNGIKIDGHLEKRRAGMRLELFKIRDCSAQFTCEVSSLDAQGNNIMNSNALQQQEAENADLYRSGAGSPGRSSEYMMLIQQLGWMENRLESRMRSIDDRIENRVADKLCQLEVKLSAQSDATKITTEETLGNYGHNTIKQLERVLDVSELVEKNLNESFGAVERHLERLRMLNTTDQESMNTLESIKLPRGESKPQGARTCKRSSELFGSIIDQISQTNTVINNTLQPISNLILPQRCKKGMVYFAVDRSFPYPVIRPSKESVLNVSYLCDDTTDGGGWIIFQRRTTGQEEFYRDWATYKRGFGSLTGDFWMGNENLHALTSSGRYELRVDLQFNGKSAFAHYREFSIASEKENYTLRLGVYDGTAGDALSPHAGLSFSTFDRDNDKASSANCASLYYGAWWYNKCHESNLNGKWGEMEYKGPRWATFTSAEPATYTEMKIRLLG